MFVFQFYSVKLMHYTCTLVLLPRRDLGALLLYSPVNYPGLKTIILQTLSPCKLSAVFSQATKPEMKMDGACHQLQTQGTEEVNEPFAQA